MRNVGDKKPPELQDRDSRTFRRIRKLYDKKSVRVKANILSKQLKIPLKHIRACAYDSSAFKGNIENPIGVSQIPLGIAGPIRVEGKSAKGNFFIPMATTEGALVLTYDLGMKLMSSVAPIQTEVLSKVIHITPMFSIKTDEDHRVGRFVDENYEKIKQTAEADSRHTQLLGIERKTVGKNFLLKFLYDTGDAQGLNMINHATFNACKYIEEKTGAFFYLRSHYSAVKHHSPLNEEKGYGRAVKATAVIPASVLEFLGVKAYEMKDLCDRCVECGKAAGVRSVNVHAANAIAAIFLACGQDAADISSAHVCESRCDVVNKGKDLYWECTLRNLLIATVGGGTGLGTQTECLKIMDCYGNGKSDKLAELIAATVLAGEFPTAASVVNRTYVDIHNKYGRNKSKGVYST